MQYEHLVRQYGTIYGFEKHLDDRVKAKVYS